MENRCLKNEYNIYTEKVDHKDLHSNLDLGVHALLWVIVILSLLGYRWTVGFQNGL